MRYQRILSAIWPIFWFLMYLTGCIPFTLTTASSPDSDSKSRSSRLSSNSSGVCTRSIVTALGFFYSLVGMGLHVCICLVNIFYIGHDSFFSSKRYLSEILLFSVLKITWNMEQILYRLYFLQWSKNLIRMEQMLQKLHRNYGKIGLEGVVSQTTLTTFASIIACFIVIFAHDALIVFLEALEVFSGYNPIWGIVFIIIEIGRASCRERV